MYYLPYQTLLYLFALVNIYRGKQSFLKKNDPRLLKIRFPFAEATPDIGGSSF